MILATLWASAGQYKGWAKRKQKVQQYTTQAILVPSENQLGGANIVYVEHSRNER